MPLVPNQSFTGPSKSLWAPAASGGGGGGGGSVSSIVNTGSSVVCDVSGVIMGASDYITGSALGVNFNNTWMLNPSLLSTTSISTTSLYASNVAVGGTGLLDAPAISGSLRLQAASLDGTGAQLLYLSSGIETASMFVTNSNVQVLNGDLRISSINNSQYPPSQSDNFPVLSVGGGASAGAALITLSSVVTGAANNQNFLLQMNSYSSNTGVNGPAFQIQSDIANSRILINNGGTPANAQIAVDNLSSINGNSYPPTNYANANITASTINQLVPIGTFAGSDDIDAIQAGFVPACPYGSTILFNKPYLTDKVSVVVIPGNKGVPNGQQPSCALGSGFGTNGVSSIGFATDYRWGGVGQSQDLFWMAFPWTN